MDRSGEAQLAGTDRWVGLPGLDTGPVDHAWLDNGHGILCCVAGHRHAPDALAVCPFYLRADIVGHLLGHLRDVDVLPSPLHYRDGLYYKLTGLVGAEHWHELVASLPARHGLRTCAWSLFSILDPAGVVAGYDPRDALRRVLDASDPTPAVDLLARLVAELGDPGNEHGSIGITGSVALAPDRIGHAADIDLLIYESPDDRPELAAVLHGLGAAFLADLATADDRLDAYRRSRVMAPLVRQSTRDVFWSRRRDVAWVAEQRVDLTWAEPSAVVIDELPYERLPLGAYRGDMRVTAVTDQFPVLARVDGHDRVTALHITARGLQDSLLPDDRITVAGLLHHDPDGGLFVSVDDAAGHQLDLCSTTDGEPSWPTS